MTHRELRAIRNLEERDRAALAAWHAPNRSRERLHALMRLLRANALILSDLDAHARAQIRRLARF